MSQRESMRCLKYSLVFLLFAAAYAEEKNTSKDGFELWDNQEKDKTSDKRWIQDNQFNQPKPVFSKELPILNVQSATEGQERAKHEKTFKDFVAYEAIQSILVNALKPKPIVDTAKESEKLAPNEGSKVQVLGDLVVKGSESLSRALNTVIDGPRQAFYKISAGATQALNQLGAYLIGL